MNIVVDSNVLFTFFWKSSVLNKISRMKGIALFSPEYALEEIKKYSIELQKKAKITKEMFDDQRIQLTNLVTFVPLSDYKICFAEINSIAKVLNENEAAELLADIDFLALSLKLNTVLWSNDTLLKKQSTVIVLNTVEIIELLG
jgi:predicted nucleic acid-binding protein